MGRKTTISEAMSYWQAEQTFSRSIIRDCSCSDGAVEDAEKRLTNATAWLKAIILVEEGWPVGDAKAYCLIH